MSQMYTQTVLFDIPLPSFLLDFKNAINSIVIPRLNAIIQDIEKQQSNSSILTLLISILLFLVLKTIIANLFIYKPVVVKHVTQAQIDQEIRSLNNEIRNLKNSVKKIIQQFGKSSLTVNDQPKQSRSSIKQQDVTKLIKNYKDAAEDFNNLASTILETKASIFEQLRNLKKIRGSAQKTSSHGSRQQNAIQLLQTSKEMQQLKSVETEAVQTPIQQIKPVQQFEVRQPPKQIRPPVPIIKKKVVPPPPAPR